MQSLKQLFCEHKYTLADAEYTTTGCNRNYFLIFICKKCNNYVVLKVDDIEMKIYDFSTRSEFKKCMRYDRNSSLYLPFWSVVYEKPYARIFEGRPVGRAIEYYMKKYGVDVTEWGESERGVTEIRYN